MSLGLNFSTCWYAVFRILKIFTGFYSILSSRREHGVKWGLLLMLHLFGFSGNRFWRLLHNSLLKRDTGDIPVKHSERKQWAEAINQCSWDWDLSQSQQKVQSCDISSKFMRLILFILLLDLDYMLALEGEITVG